MRGATFLADAARSVRSSPSTRGIPASRPGCSPGMHHDQRLLANYATAVNASDRERLMLFALPRTAQGLTVAVGLLFLETPHVAMPEAFVRVLRFRGRERGSGSRQQLLEDERVDGPIPRLLIEARAKIKDLVPTRRALMPDAKFGDVSLKGQLLDRARAIVRMIRDAERASTGEVVEALGLSRPVVAEELQALRQAGVIEWVGKSAKDPGVLAVGVKLLAASPRLSATSSYLQARLETSAGETRTTTARRLPWWRRRPARERIGAGRAEPLIEAGATSSASQSSSIAIPSR